MLEIGDCLEFYDARGKQRMLKIADIYPVFAGVGYIAECFSSAYVELGTEMYIKGKEGKHNVGVVVDMPAAERFIKLRVGDLLTISREINQWEPRLLLVG